MKIDIKWHEVEIGAIVKEPGSASEYKTGDWRSEVPVRDNEKCIKCGICYIFCPEGCIYRTEDGYFDANLYYCKGCGICAYECPRGVIRMIEEKKE
ncbi:MAG: 4Fe-4S binding protein [Canidatus Methanoxibalbensis ujae]|nr:4Fe-4S binding protein [Candidatus Methanoxibalbensis ujae]MCW7078271.1 4Fe-4S binding protein [Candidatus Methanoxibalbensis ujae]RLG38904.1 MAG: pyruvate synthase subunit PorD [Methanosarcinales archaeon]